MCTTRNRFPLKKSSYNHRRHFHYHDRHYCARLCINYCIGKRLLRGCGSWHYLSQMMSLVDAIYGCANQCTLQSGVCTSFGFVYDGFNNVYDCWLYVPLSMVVLTYANSNEHDCTSNTAFVNFTGWVAWKFSRSPSTRFGFERCSLTGALLFHYSAFISNFISSRV